MDRQIDKQTDKEQKDSWDNGPTEQQRERQIYKRTNRQIDS